MIHKNPNISDFSAPKELFFNDSELRADIKRQTKKAKRVFNHNKAVENNPLTKKGKYHVNPSK